MSTDEDPKPAARNHRHARIDDLEGTRDLEGALRAFAAIMTEFGQPVTARNYQRWAAADPLAPSVDAVIATYGSWKATPLPPTPPRETGSKSDHASLPPQPTLAETRALAFEQAWGQQITELFERGLRAAAIAETIDQSPSRVRQFLERNSLRHPRGATPSNSERDRAIVQLRREGLTLQEVCDRFGVSRERVRQIVEKTDAERSTSPSDRKRRTMAEEHGDRILALTERSSSVAELLAHVPELPAS